MFDTGLELSRWLLSWLSLQWQTVLAVPLLIVMLLVALTLIVRLLPVVDRVLGPLGGGLATVLGLLALLPEYVCTVTMRRHNRQPPAIFHTYGDGVEGLVQLGHRVSQAGLTGFTRGNGVRKLMIFAALCVIVTLGNAHSCPAQAPGCSRPLAVWWNQTKTLLDEKPAPPARTKTTKKPTKKPTPKKTNG
jgi:hypothetical protein